MAEISKLCRQSKPDASTFTEVLQLLKHMLPFDAATLYLLASDTRKLRPQANVGTLVRLPEIILHKDENSREQANLMSGTPVLLTEKQLEGFQQRSLFARLLVVPLMLDGGLIGVLLIASENDFSLLQKHVKLMTIVADQLAISIERRTYIATIVRQNKALKKAHEELKEAQEAQVAAERLAAVGELAASINHEINNPLAVVVGNVQCMRLENPDMSKRSTLRMQRIEEAALRIGEVNRRLLTINSLESDPYLDNEQERMLNLEKSTKPLEEITEV